MSLFFPVIWEVFLWGMEIFAGFNLSLREMMEL